MFNDAPSSMILLRVPELITPSQHSIRIFIIILIVIFYSDFFDYMCTLASTSRARMTMT